MKTIEDCPFKIGDRVVVSPSNRYAGEWIGEYIITGMRWEYQRGHGDEINIAVASDPEIEGGHGDTDGWRPSDWVAVASHTTRNGAK